MVSQSCVIFSVTVWYICYDNFCNLQMVDGSRMPSRMVQPQGLLPYDDSYQIRHAHAPRLVDALQGHGQMVVGSEHGASRPGGIHPNQEEGLEDLLSE